MGWPKTYSANDAPAALLDLAGRLVPLLLAGEHPALAALRAQYAAATVTGVELTGAGFFVEFSVPSDAPRVEPPQLTGGSVRIRVEGLEHGAGCLLFVRDGTLKTLEGFTYGEEWPERPSVVSLSDAVPLLSNDPPSEAR
jgi:hypothetical protein